jgi:predicted nucleotidyltransferase
MMSIYSDNHVLTQSQLVTVLTQNYAVLAKEFPIASLALFGSYARNEQTPQSDIDLLVTFSQPVGFGFMHLANRLEALLGKRVDLIAADGIKPNRRNSILASLIHVAP